MSRVQIRNKKTGAIWSSAMPELGVWRKEFMGAPELCSLGTKPYGYVAQGFFPFRKKHKGVFEVI